MPTTKVTSLRRRRKSGEDDDSVKYSVHMAEDEMQDSIGERVKSRVRKQESSADVVLIDDLDDESEEIQHKSPKSVKQLTAQRIVDEVTRNLKYKPKAQRQLKVLPPPRTPAPRVSYTHTSKDTENLMQYFMFQYKILESCESGNNTSTQAQPDSYTFLTFIMKRFLTSMTKLISQVDPNFNLTKWDKSTLDDLKIRTIPTSERSALVHYLESVFGRLPTALPPSEHRLSDVGKTVNHNPEHLPPSDESNKLKDQIGAVLSRLDANIKNSINKSFEGENEDCNDDYMPQELEDDDEAMNVSQSVDTGKLELAKPKNNKLRAKNMAKLVCTYCHKGNFDFMGRYISHMMMDHCAKKVAEFVCEKCNLCTIINSKSSLSNCTNHAKGKCVDGKSEGKKKFNENGLTFVKCGLCSYKIEAFYENDMLKLDTDEIVDHYMQMHNPQYYCEVCQTSFNTPEIFDSHKNYCRGPNSNEAVPLERPEIVYYMQHKCAVHNIEFKDEFEYADHCLQFHLLDFTGGEMVRVLSLNLAALTARKDEKFGLRFPCNICNSEEVMFETAQEWSTHAAMNHKSAGYQCDVCCKFMGCIKQHNRNTHAILDEHYFRCNYPDCLYKGALFDNVLSHVKGTHKEQLDGKTVRFKKYCATQDCDFYVEVECTNGVLSKEYKKKCNVMFRHRKRHHMKKFCDKCGKFIGRGYYEQHMESHMAEETGIKKYECPHCKQSFIHRKSMVDHVKRHDLANKKHVCYHCGKKFFTSGDLCTHIKVTHLTDEEKQFACDNCNKRFARKGLLRGHMKHCCPETSHFMAPPAKQSRPSVNSETCAAAATLANLQQWPNEHSRIESNPSPANNEAIEAPASATYTTLSSRVQPSPVPYREPHIPAPARPIIPPLSNLDTFEHAQPLQRIDGIPQHHSQPPAMPSQFQRLPNFSSRNFVFDTQSESHLAAYFASYPNYEVVTTSGSLMQQ